MLTEEQAKQLLNMLVSVDKEQQILAATILCNELDIYINTTYEYNPNTGKFTPKIEY